MFDILKIRRIFIVLSVVIIFASPFPNDEDTRKIFARVQIEKEGARLVRQGLYGQAIEKYREALQPQYLNYDYDKSIALSEIIKIYQFQRKLDEAKATLDEYRTIALPNDFYKRKKPEIDVMIQMRGTGSVQPIYSHIEYLQREYGKFLPPKSFHPGIAVTVISDTIRLYDYLGDYDAGISFIDGILAYARLNDKMREEYLKVKQAFLKDKAEGAKGRATQALIKSDILPW
jgi:tetratricopeptide (TPR) repeat protein